MAHLILYDGGCGLCDRFVQKVLDEGSGRTFRFAALQGPKGAAFLEPFRADPRVRKTLKRLQHPESRLNSMHLILNYDQTNPRLLSGGRAALAIGHGLGHWWGIGADRSVDALTTAILELGYQLVARNRYWIFGGADACRTVPADQRYLFVDLEPRPQISRSSGEALF